MNSNKRQKKQMLICILTAALILLLYIPVFAAGGDLLSEQKDGEPVEVTEQTEQAEPEAEETEQGEQSEPAETGTAEGENDEEEKETGQDDKSDGSKEKADPVDDSKTETGAQAPAAAKEVTLKAASGLPANNSTVSYTSAGSHPVKFTVKTSGYTFKGTCATLGVNNAKSGKATVKRLSNNSKIAKLVYYYGYKKGWWQGANSTKKATTVLGFTDKNCTENAKQCIEALIQLDNMGWTAFWNSRKVGGYRMYSTDSFMKEIHALYKKDVSKIKIPDDVVFEMFHGVTSSSKQQDFYVWRYKVVPTTPNGFVAVEKVSADVSITD